MAIRTVFLRFSSNANAFAADMTRVAASTQLVQEAGSQAAKAQLAQQSALAAAADATNARQATEIQLQAEQAAVTDTNTAITRLLAKAKAEAAAAATLHSASMEREAEAATLNEQASLRQAAILEGVRDQQAAAAAAREAELATLSAAETEAGLAATRAGEAAAEASNMATAATEKQAAAQDALMGRVGTASLLGGVAVGFGLYEAAKAAMQFQGEMQKVAAISVVARQNLGQMSTEVLNLSKEMPVSAEEFASALLVAEQAGYHGYQAIALLHTAAEGATIGFSSTTDATKDLSRVLNGFGLTAADAANVNNILVAAVQNGIGSYHNFGDALAQIGPLAKAANISINDAAGAIAAMSSKGIEAQGAGMGLIRMIFNMGKEGSSTEKAFVDLVNTTTSMHVENGAAALSALGLSGTIELLGKQTEGASGAIEALFPSVRQAKAAFALLSDGGTDAIAMMKLFNNQEALAEKEAVAWAESQKSTANQMKIATNEVQAAGITLGSDFLPALASTANFLAGLVTSLANFNSALGGVPIKVLAGAAGFAVMFGIVTKMQPAMAALNAMFAAHAASAELATVAEEGLAGAEAEVAAGEVAIEAASGPIGWIALGLTAAVAALGIYSMGSEDAAKSTADFTTALGEQQSGVAGATATLVQHDLASSGLTKSFNDVGISLKDVTGAILANGDSTKTQIDLTNKFIDVLGVSDGALQKAGYTEKQRGQIHDDVAKAVRGDKDALADMNQVLATSGTVLTHVNAKHLDLINKLAEERHSFVSASDAQSESQKALVESTKEYNVHLFRTGEQLEDVDASLTKLTPHQIELQKGIQGFIDLGAAMDEATKKTIDNQATFTTGADIFKDLLADRKKALQDQAQQMADDYNASLTASTQDAQDAARTQAEINHDTLAATTQSTKAANAAQKELAHDSTASAQQAARDTSRANTAAHKSAADFLETLGPAQVDLDKYLSGLTDTASATQKWRDDLDRIAAKGGSQAFVDDLRKLGKDGVPLVTEFADATVEQIAKANYAMGTLAPTAEASYSEFQKAMLQQMTDESDWEKNLNMLAMRGGGDLAEQFIQLAKKQGKKSSGALAEALKLSDADLKQANDQAIQYGKIGSDGYTQNFETTFTALKRAADASGTDSGKAFVDSMSQEFSVLGMNDVDVMTFLKKFQNQIAAYSPALARELFAGSLGDAPDALSNQEGRGSSPGGGVSEGKDQGTTPGSGATTSVPQSPEVRPRVRTQAWGGFYAFENGSEHHVAQFAQGGDWRLWAEPETGGEAYIPLSAAKRSGSMNILNAVAGQFGYDLHRKGQELRPTGAQLTGGGGRAGDMQVTHVVVQQPVSKKTDYNFNGPIIGYRLEQVTADADRKSRLAALSGGR